MGDPPKLRNKYSRPQRLWDVDRLKNEKGLKREFGLKNMRELWMTETQLKKYRREARRLLALTQEERENSEQKVLSKLVKLGVLKDGASLDDVLSLSVRDFLERRLQTIVKRKDMARTMVQSRQLITHGFISVNDQRVSVPSYLVDAKTEGSISYAKKIDIEPPTAPQDEKKAESTSNESKENKPDTNEPGENEKQVE
ncbi:MAG TPA: 30S ribosomal protein S4 [Candidatus Bilamarchaeaceae archaeon]|nr:30S ribosomal protein S4 [Candidatus Bilamarchaeaceae archaeon]